MNTLHHLSRGPAQRAATEFKNTLSGMVAEVHEMGAAVDELAARENKSPGPAPGAEAESAAASPPHQENALPAVSSEGSAVQRAAPTVASVALPQIPDPRPQLEAVRDALIRNQHLTMDTLRSMKLLLDAQAGQLVALREQFQRQASCMSDLRRF
jgi:hypothetical protein